MSGNLGVNVPQQDIPPPKASTFGILEDEKLELHTENRVAVDSAKKQQSEKEE